MLNKLYIFLLIIFCNILNISCKSAEFYADLKHVEIKSEIMINTNIESHQIKVKVKNIGNQKIGSYYIAIPADKVSSLSFVQAATPKSKLLTTEAIELNNINAPSNTLFYRVLLRKPIKPNNVRKIYFMMAFTHTLKPLPNEIKQDDAQNVLWNGNYYTFTPYKSDKQSLNVKLASSNILSHGSKLQPVKINRHDINYGPYENVKEFQNEKLSIHYENNYPFVTFTDFRKDIEVSHWGNVAIEEHYILKHTGAKLKGSFSRHDYQRGRGQSGKSSFRTIVAHLPKGAHDTYYRDHIGNISTSHVRQERNHVVMELDPRFPIFGGWKTDFYTGYNLDVSSVLSIDINDNTKHVLNMTFSTPFLDAVVDHCEVHVILPEGATNIQFVAPFPVDTSKNIHHTYLDTVGRPVLILKKDNLVQYHHSKYFQVVYTFNQRTIFREPLFITIGFFAFFLACIAYMRIDLSLSKSS